MGKLWQELQMNYPVHVGGVVLVLVALTLVARPRWRTRAGVWAAVGLIGSGLTNWFYLVEATFRLYPTPAVYAGVSLVQAGFLGLLFAAVVIDRRGAGHGGG